MIQTFPKVLDCDLEPRHSVQLQPFGGGSTCAMGQVFEDACRFNGNGMGGLHCQIYWHQDHANFDPSILEVCCHVFRLQESPWAWIDVLHHHYVLTNVLQLTQLHHVVAFKTARFTAHGCSIFQNQRSGVPILKCRIS